MNKKERLQLENELLMTCSKAQAINKYIDELEESSKLSELWCKSQEENTQLKIQLLEKKCSDKDIEYKEKIKLQQRIERVIKIIKEYKECNLSKYDENEIEIELIDKILEILKGENNDNSDNN